MAVAQLGPIHLADTREAVVKRLLDMLREAHAQAAPDAPDLLLRLAGAKAVCQRAGWQDHKQHCARPQQGG